MSPKTISASKLRSNLADALDSIERTDVLVVTRRGKNEKAIINLDVLEDLLESTDPKFVASIRKAREEYKKGEVFSLDEVFEGI